MDIFYPLSTDLDGATTAINNLGTGGLSNLLDTGDPQQGATCTNIKEWHEDMHDTRLWQRRHGYQRRAERNYGQPRTYH